MAPGELPDHERRARILECPRHGFILFRAILAPGIEAKPLPVLAVGDSAFNRRAVRVDVEDRKEDSDPAHLRFHNVGFFDFHDVSHHTVGRSNHRIERRQALRGPGREKMPACKE